MQPRHVVGSSFFFVSELAALLESTPNFSASDICAPTPGRYFTSPDIVFMGRNVRGTSTRGCPYLFPPVLIAMHIHASCLRYDKMCEISWAALAPVDVFIRPDEASVRGAFYCEQVTTDVFLYVE